MHYNMAFILKQCFCLLSFLMMVQVCLGRYSVSIIQEVGSYAAEKVPLNLYYESLCPYSANFIVNGLAPIFKNGIIDIVDLKLIPWGNAKIKSNGSFACQHGPKECFLNTIEACAIGVWPKLNEHFPFINCVENLVYHGNESEWRTCYKTLGLDDKPVELCYSSGYGNKLERKYAVETANLQPPHLFVPWVVVNKQPLQDEYKNFTSYVCKAYKGTPPSACSGKFSGAFLKEKADQFYTDETTKVPLLMSWMQQMINIPVM